MSDNNKHTEYSSPAQTTVLGSSNLDETCNISGLSIPHLELEHGSLDANPLPKKDSALTYGQLVILGYNGSLPQGEKGRRRSKFVLCKRPVFNGVKKSQSYVDKTPQSSRSDKNIHSVSYSFSSDRTVTVEYEPDNELDMFQIGRSSENSIDFIVIDTISSDKVESKDKQCRVSPDKTKSNDKQSRVSLDKTKSNDKQNRVSPDKTKSNVKYSTVSRFACRILIQRSANFTARVYAAGFDSSKNIFLGGKATKWQDDDGIDGLTTNGILVMHPLGPFTSGSEPGPWRELSVGGQLYTLRSDRSTPLKGIKINKETNVLQDGTMIDLCGVTLLWRSPEGLSKSPTRYQLENKINELNSGRPRCPVRLNTLIIPWTSTLLPDDKQPYVYLTCGHVQGLHDWGKEKGSSSRTCPMCRTVGPIVKLAMGKEPSFYVDCEPPTFAFNPCGHMTSEKTVKYWASVPIPHGTDFFHSVCPFCATPLSGNPGYIKLIFQDHVH